MMPSKEAFRDALAQYTGLVADFQLPDSVITLPEGEGGYMATWGPGRVFFELTSDDDLSISSTDGIGIALAHCASTALDLGIASGCPVTAALSAGPLLRAALEFME